MVLARIALAAGHRPPLAMALAHQEYSDAAAYRKLSARFRGAGTGLFSGSNLLPASSVATVVTGMARLV